MKDVLQWEWLQQQVTLIGHEGRVTPKRGGVTVPSGTDLAESLRFNAAGKWRRLLIGSKKSVIDRLLWRRPLRDLYTHTHTHRV